MFILFILAAGILVAFTSVFFGVGGGILLVPLLPSFFNMTVHQAVQTSLTTITLVVLVNTYMFNRSNLVEWRLVKYMGPLSAVGAFVAAKVAQMVDARYILIFLIILLGMVAVRGVIMSMQKLDYEVPEVIPTYKKVISVVGGGVAGAASGFAGIGSGTILSPLMIIMKLIPPQKLTPTANANMVFATSAGSLSYFMSGHYINWRQWGDIRLDIAIGVFLVAYVVTALIRPHQNKLPFEAKAIGLNLLLLFLIGKVVYMLLL